MTFLPEIWQSAHMTTQTLPNVGSAVRAEMGRQQITMVELARRSGIPRSTLQHQINLSALTVNNLLLIAKSLNVAPADLLGKLAA